MTVKELKEWVKDLPEDLPVQVRLRGAWTDEFTLRIKYIRTVGYSRRSLHTAGDDE